jgi:CrcB protein
MPFLIVFAGGALGSLARYSIGLATDQFWQLLIVNIVGTALLGYLNSSPNERYRNLFLGTGFAGGFTTLSAASVLINPSTSLQTVAYLLAMLAAGIGAYLLGRKLAAK